MKPPTADELVGPPPHGLDEAWALKNFLGKSQDQARAMFHRGSALTEDFTYMAPAGLCYYLPAALNYLESEDSNGDWDFAHGLMCALSGQVGTFGMRGEPVILIKQIAEYCHAQRAKFDFTPSDLFDEYLESIRGADL